MKCPKVRFLYINKLQDIVLRMSGNDELLITQIILTVTASILHLCLLRDSPLPPSYLPTESQEQRRAIPTILKAFHPQEQSTITLIF